jgi:hypothetical protein
MSTELTRADAKAYACSYILGNLLQHLNGQQPGLIHSLIAGVEGDFAAIQAQGSKDVPGPVPAIVQEALAILHKANGNENSESAISG